MIPKQPIRRVAAAAAALLLVPGCAAQVTHPTKSVAEMQADIDLCTDQANRKYWMDPIAALYNAYDCLEAKGYERDRNDMAGKVEKALGEAPARETERRKAEPCKVPCRR
ncbi:MAG: hypothetical protein ACK40O_12410 [Allosphingosinicella sp.]